MRFTKADVLEAFQQQDISYRLAILSSHWLRGGAQYQPTARDEANSLSMIISGKEIRFADVGKMLGEHSTMIQTTSIFVLNQLHTTVRAPFELLRDYCEDYDGETQTELLVPRLQKASWFEFARLVRNAISHNFHFEFVASDRKKLPVTWNGITISGNLEGMPITYEIFAHRPGYELFLEMKAFADELPET